MDIFWLLFGRVGMMFLYMLIGIFLFRAKLVSKEGCKELGKILLYVVLPAAIMKSCLSDRSTEMVIGLLLSFVIAVISLGVSIILSYAVFNKKYPIENFGSAFSNAGFIGIPLIEGMWGTKAVFFAASYIALLNILQWTYGVYIMSGKKENIRPKKIVQNPICISFTLGCLVFLLAIPVPELLRQALSGVASMNGPLAMIILGIYFAQISLKDLFTEKNAYKCTFIRLICSPILTFLLLCLVPGRFMDIRFAILAAACAPVGSNVAIFAHMENQNYKQAVVVVCLSTLFCIITIPLLISLAYYFWNVNIYM